MSIRQDEVTEEGIVIYTMPYKENDALITVFFQKYGKLTLLAKGVRKMKSKNAASCNPLTKAEFTFVLRSGICRLVRATYLNAYLHLQESLQANAVALFFLEYLYRSTSDNVPNLKQYQFLEELLLTLNNGAIPQIVYMKIISFILEDCGSSVFVDGCVICETKRNIVSISVLDGGFICENHYKMNMVHYRNDILDGFRKICKIPITKIDQLHFSSETTTVLLGIFEQFLNEYCHVRFFSKKFIKW